MKKYGLLSVIASVCIVTSPVAANNTAQIQQYIAPLECVKDIVENGVSSEVYLMPYECHQEVQPGGVTNVPNAPDTGGGVIIDGVRSNDLFGWFVVVLGIGVALLIRRQSRESSER